MREENRQKHSTLRSVQKEFSSLKVSLQNELNWIYFGHVSILFFVIDNRILKSESSVQQKKLYKLLQKGKAENDPEKVIFTFSKYVLFDIEKYFLAKGLSFCHLSNLSMPIICSILNCFIDILSNEDLDSVKAKTKETALSSFRQYNKNSQQNLSEEELAALTKG